MGCGVDNEFINNQNQPVFIHPNSNDAIRSIPTRININAQQGQQQEQQQQPRQPEPYLQSHHDPNFNFPEVSEEIYVGKGLKKMKGYISPISKEDLEKKRNSFWGTRIEGNEQTWNFLRELCQMPQGEEENIIPMLEAYNLVPYKDCINITYDSLGGLYEIPNYCINDPYKYEIEEEEKKERPPEEKLTFHLRKGVHQTRIKCSNYSSVQKIKEKFAKRNNFEEKKIRFFFYGKELKDNYELWYYNISEDCVVMVMILP